MMGGLEIEKPCPLVNDQKLRIGLQNIFGGDDLWFRLPGCADGDRDGYELLGESCAACGAEL